MPDTINTEPPAAAVTLTSSKDEHHMDNIMDTGSCDGASSGSWTDMDSDEEVCDGPMPLGRMQQPTSIDTMPIGTNQTSQSLSTQSTHTIESTNISALIDSLSQYTSAGRQSQSITTQQSSNQTQSNHLPSTRNHLLTTHDTPSSLFYKRFPVIPQNT